VAATYYSLGDQAELETAAKQKIAEVGEEGFWETVRRIILFTTDTLWVEHIDTMEHMRQSVGLRAYGQREPLVEYKKEATRLFREMEARLREQAITMISGISLEERK
jgi:preprotein translocase subunit SecA